MNRSILIMVIGGFLLLSLNLTGCSKDMPDPIVNNNIPDEAALPVFNVSENQTNRELLGTWTAQFDLESLTASVKPSREASTHYNATWYIPAPQIQVDSWDPVNQIMGVIVTLHNPYLISAYDVRLIIYTDSIGHELLNADNWTPFFDIPGGNPDNLNPFISFAKDDPFREFQGERDYYEYLQIKLPGANTDVKFAIDASLPGNCQEPYTIYSFSQELLYDLDGSSADVEVYVDDWQNDIFGVFLVCPPITNTILFQHGSGSRWYGTITNAKHAPPGEYSGYVVASSGGQGLVQPVTIVVSDCSNGWTRTYGGINSFFGAGPSSIVTDSVGNAYVSGSFSGTIDFDPHGGTPKTANGSVLDCYISKFNGDGIFQWVWTWGIDNYDGCNDVVVDNLGFIYTTGYYTESINTTSDAFFYKLDQNGDFEWTKFWGSTGEDIGLALCWDGVTTIYISGLFANEVDFDPGPNEKKLTSNGATDAYLSRFDLDGDFIDVKQFGGPDSDCSYDVSSDNTGIYITGSFRESVDFDPGPGESVFQSNGLEDVYLCKLNNAGEYQWAYTCGGPLSDVGLSVVSSESSYWTFVAGNYSDEFNFNPGPGQDYHISNGKSDAFLVRLSPSGIYNTTLTWGGTEDDCAYGVTMDSTGNAYVTGGFYGTVDLDPTQWGEDWHISNGYWDIFLIAIHNQGYWLWSKSWGTNATYYSFSEAGMSVYINSTDDLLLCGYCGDFQRSIDFDIGCGKDIHSIIGISDAFIMKLNAQ